MTEADFMRQVTDLAAIYGYQWAHFRPAQTSKGWRTPVSGSLGSGWPDLVLVRERDERVLFRELKADNGKVSPAQFAVHNTLATAGLDVGVWRPRNFDQIQEELR